MNRLLVSISCITYNHAPYIRQCLDGFLMQQCDFEYEILIHDDASTDGTSDIIREYQEKYPEIIKPIMQTENQYSKGIRGMMARFNFPRAKGKYIALCEGDDYWTDPLKLQKQVDFLEENPKFNICGHSVACSKYNYFLEKKLLLNKDAVYPLKSVVQTNPIHTSSFCFRNNSYFKKDEFYNYMLKMGVGDYPLLVLLSQSNGAFAFKDVMSVYRIDNQESLWMGKLNLEVQQKLMEKTINAMIVSPFYNKVTKKYLKEKLKKKKIHFLKRVLLKIKKNIKSIVSKLKYKYN